MGLSVFEIKCLTDELLDQLVADVERTLPHSADECPRCPVETAERGRYFLDLVKLQEAHPEVSSKQALREFLSTSFRDLTLICSHVPPWIEAQLPDRRLSYTTERVDATRYKVTILHA
jgi:hypothetical protein